jgi:anti-anti-sigma factor
MSLEEKQIKDVLIIQINYTRATFSEANFLKSAIEKGIEKGYVKIILDLSNCEYVDSTFLSIMVNGLKQVSKLNGDIRVVGLQPTVLAMFELTRIFRVFQTYSDLQKAVDSFDTPNQ